VKATLKFAMVQDIVVAYQRIACPAAQEKNLDAYLQMMADARKMLPLVKDEAARGGPRSPRGSCSPLTRPSPSPRARRRRRPAAASSRPQEHQSRCLAAERS
jgi:hypothetical protein